MNRNYRTFYRSFYLQSGGYIPCKPLQNQMLPGDFFKIINGEIIVFGNIFKEGIVSKEEVVIDYEIQLNPSSWIISDGVSKPTSGRSKSTVLGNEFEYYNQVLAFAKSGAFNFKAIGPESTRIANWSELADSLIIKLTQTLFSFREVYVVSEIASCANWTLAISRTDQGELEIATDDDSFGLVDIFGDSNSRTIKSKDIEFYHNEDHRKPQFFKAKKLTVKNEKLNTFISDLSRSRNETDVWVKDYFDYPISASDSSPIYNISIGMGTSLLDMLSANELNPNTALNYFSWEDSNLDDVEKLFFTYDE